MFGRLAATLSLITCSFISSPFLYAQSQVVFGFVGIRASGDAIPTSEIRVLENRVTSELVDVANQKDYGLFIPGDRERILSELTFSNESVQSQMIAGRQVAATALIAGNLTRSGDEYALALVLVSVESAQTQNLVNGTYHGFDAVLNDSSTLVYRLFSVSAPNASENNVSFLTHPTLTMVAGTWKGDAGVETVTIRADGSATAVLDSQNSMMLRVSISGNLVIVRQDEPNAPKMYTSLYPYSVAVQLAALARPMQWTFQLSTSGQELQGMKDTTSVRIERGTIASVDNTYSRPATWQREQ